MASETLALADSRGEEALLRLTGLFLMGALVSLAVTAGPSPGA
jgi:hypothetical protein